MEIWGEIKPYLAIGGQGKRSGEEWVASEYTDLYRFLSVHQFNKHC